MSTPFKRREFSRWLFDWRRYPQRLLFVGIVSGYIICLTVPVFVHSSWLEEGEVKHRPFFHYPVFHTSWYADPLPSLTISGNRLRFSGGEIWEVWAIAHALFTTLLIQFRAVRRGVIWISLLSGLFSVLALAALGFHNLFSNHYVAYGIFLILALLCFMACDWQMWDSGDLSEREFKAMWWFVDVPTIIGLSFFFLYIWKWSTSGLLDRQNLIGADFISGAIAFQLIVGNVTLLIIRFGIHERLPRFPHRTPLVTAPATTAEVPHGTGS